MNTIDRRAFQFFFEHAGYVVGRRAAGAIALARAEQWASDQDMCFCWSEDWDIGNHYEWHGEGSCYTAERPNPETCENLLLKDLEGNILASLGCIDDADESYRRVVEAELALEAMHNAKDVNNCFAD